MHLEKLFLLKIHLIRHISSRMIFIFEKCRFGEFKQQDIYKELHLKQILHI